MDRRYGAYYAAFYGSGAPVEVPFLTRLACLFDLPTELRVLDIGCGTGRLLGPLAALGWRVVGMDPQPENVAEARRVTAVMPGLVDILPGGFGDLDVGSTPRRLRPRRVVHELGVDSALTPANPVKER